MRISRFISVSARRNDFRLLLPLLVVFSTILAVSGGRGGVSAQHLSEPRVADSDSVISSDSISPLTGDSLSNESVDSLPASASSGKRKGLGELGNNIKPVESDDGKPAQPILHYFDKHGNPLKDPVLFLAELDTVKAAKSGPVYPLLNSVSVGANFFDAVMLACGQKHAGFDLWADLSLYNWFFPVVEVGAGYADNHPADGNFHYKSPLSLYWKLGFNYNFLYKSNPAYQAFIGLRAGFSHFSYDVTDITVTSPYWQQSQGFDLLGQTASVFYGEALAGIKVKLVGNLSMGWNIRVHFKMHTHTKSSSNPWYVPGYGTSGILGATFSLIYTLPLHKGKKEASDVDIDLSE